MNQPARDDSGLTTTAVVAVALSALAVAGTHVEPTLLAPRERFADGTLRQRGEFELIAERLGRESRYYERGVPETLERQRAVLGIPPDEWRRHTERLIHALLRDGRVDEATTVAEELVRRLRLRRERDARVWADAHWLRGLAYWRRAEVANCVHGHDADRCLFPLRGGGRHTAAPDYARQAKADWSTSLALVPDQLATRWLLNLAQMALGQRLEELGALAIPTDAFSAPDRRIRRFRDVAEAAGVATFDLAGGSVVEDLDGDGWLDIVSSTSDPSGPLSYYRNVGDGRWEDRSEPSHLADQRGGLNLVGADFDNDGDADLFVARGAWLADAGQVRNSLLRNDGHGIFTDVTRRLRLAEPEAPTQVGVWLDYDGDGDLDLYVCNESRADQSASGEPVTRGGDYPSQLFRNDRGDGFYDVALAAGVTNDRFCKGASAGDFDNDGWPDLYVSNIGPNRLYRNRGDGTFVDTAETAGVTLPDGRSFATWFFDFDNDGWLDIFVAAYDARVSDIAASYVGAPHEASWPRLYHNERNGTFADVTDSAGLGRPLLPMGANYGDFDNDGWLDIYLGTGAPPFEALMPNVALLNEAGRRFVDITEQAGLGHLQKGHGVSFGDLDHDGDQDIFHQLGGFWRGDRFANALFANPGHGNRFLSIRLVGHDSNRMGYGARVSAYVETREGSRVIRRDPGATSSFGGSTSRVEIGLGRATAIARLEIHWPVTGVTQRFDNVPLDSFVEVDERNGLRQVVVASFSWRQ